MNRFVVINSKGGCGKTTLASNLASYYAASGTKSMLIDHDPQESSMRWLSLRPDDAPSIYGVAAAKGHAATTVTQSFHLRPPPGTERVILDTPASLKRLEIAELLRGADAIVVPILPSAIDSFVSLNFVRELLSIARSYAVGVPIGIVANRVRRNTLSSRRLERDVEQMSLNMVASLRDTQNYVVASEMGLGIHELYGRNNRRDLEQWEPLIRWLEGLVNRPSAEPVLHQPRYV